MPTTVQGQQGRQHASVVRGVPRGIRLYTVFGRLCFPLWVKSAGCSTRGITWAPFLSGQSLLFGEWLGGGRESSLRVPQRTHLVAVWLIDNGGFYHSGSGGG